jgi:osmotically-inducible protein OsmY
MIRADTDIQSDITNELNWEPSLRDDDIAVAVRDGVVTLAGYVDSYLDKWKAEQVIGRVKGVKAVANELLVRLPTSSVRPDPEIARAVVDALKWNISVPHDRITVRVERGWVTLEGEVDYHYQRKAAERAVRHITGVRGVTNVITVLAQPAPTDIKERITEALRRSADLGADRITVEVEGNKVILRGTVRSYTEYKEAERAVRDAPGITEVDNRLTIEPGLYSGV